MDWLTVCPDGVDDDRACRRSRPRTCVALLLGVVLLAMLVRRSRDFTTATLSLMAVAIAINITIGSLTALLRLPLYLDSVGTVLVGALAGPWAGALTGLLSNLVWSLLPIPGGAGPATAFFAPVAATVGLLAGFWASRGVFGLRSDDDRIGGFLALAFGIGAAGGGDARRPGDDRPLASIPRTRTRNCASLRSGSTIVAVGVVAAWASGRTVFGLRGDDARIRGYLVGATTIAAAALVFALVRLLFAPDRLLLGGDHGLVTNETGDPIVLDLTGLALPDPLGMFVALALAAGVAALAFAWARRGDHARLFPVWVGGFTTGIVAACIAAPIAAGVVRRRDRRRHGPGGRPVPDARPRRLPVGPRPGPHERPARQDDQLHGRLRHPDRAADHRAHDVQPRHTDRSRRDEHGVGVLLEGATWLHVRHPVTKLLGVLFVLVAAFLLPPVALGVLGLVVIATAISAGLGERLLRSFRIPGLLLVSIVVVNGLLFPGGRDVLASLGPLAITREGLTLRPRLGRPPRRRVRGVDAAPADDAAGRPPRGPRGARRQPSHRVRGAVRRPAHPADARPGRPDPGRPIGAGAGRGRVHPDAGPCPGATDRTRCLAPSSMSANGRWPSRRAASGRDPDGPRIASSPTQPRTAHPDRSPRRDRPVVVAAVIGRRAMTLSIDGLTVTVSRTSRSRRSRRSPRGLGWRMGRGDRPDRRRQVDDRPGGGRAAAAGRPRHRQRTGHPR